jgi:H+/Cl- antiporter ClcA
MRMSASMCLILMEMTGAPTTLPFLMMSLVIAKGVGDRFNYRSDLLLSSPLNHIVEQAAPSG